MAEVHKPEEILLRRPSPSSAALAIPVPAGATPQADRAPGPARPFRVVRHMRPLYFDGDTLYCSRFADLHATRDFGATFTRVGHLELRPWRLKLAGCSSLAQRILRAGVYRLRALENGNLVCSFRKGLYTLEAGQTDARRTFVVPRGARPVSLEAAPGGPVVFGEYWGNPARREVHVYGSWDAGLSWDVLHTFPARSVRHVHGITYDRWEGCFWLCTGDYGDECRVLRASRDFRTVETVLAGGQRHRIFSLYAAPDRLVMANDTPLDQNYILTYDKHSGRLRRLQPIENSSFYHCAVAGRVFFSTTAEPSPVNDSGRSHVWVGQAAGGKWRRVLSFGADRYTRFIRRLPFPKGFLQYPRVFFPDGRNDSDVLVCYATGLQGYDGAMLCYDASALDPSGVGGEAT